MNDKRLQILANNIRAERIRKRLSQEELAESIMDIYGNKFGMTSFLKLVVRKGIISIFFCLDDQCCIILDFLAKTFE